MHANKMRRTKENMENFQKQIRCHSTSKMNVINFAIKIAPPFKLKLSVDGCATNVIITFSISIVFLFTQYEFWHSQTRDKIDVSWWFPFELIVVNIWHDFVWNYRIDTHCPRQKKVVLKLTIKRYWRQSYPIAHLLL